MDKIADTGHTLSPGQLSEIILTIKNLYGFDFDLYRKASLLRRILRIMDIQQLNFYDLKHNLVNSKSFFSMFLEEVTVNVTEMFRDPSFYISIQKNILPYLSTYPRIKCWSAGCSTGEEAYSLAIFLQENNLYGKSFIYGTDINNQVVQKARMGIYNLSKIKSYTENYRQAKLPGELLNHFTVSYDAAAISNSFKNNMLFSQHNLLSDSVFNEFQIIMCRNVFIYFEPELQKRVIRLFYDSLCPFGFLCLGSKEVLPFSEIAGKFKVIDKVEHIYQKIA